MSKVSKPLAAAKASPLTATQWLICIIAAIGFAFDTYELLMAPLILPPALQELGKLVPGTKDFSYWAGLMFYVPAIFGGIFGLLGGYLTDVLGRRRVLTWSILLYAFSAFAAGFSTTLPMLLFFRCLVFVGVCVEFVAAVAWLAELFDDPIQREKVLGYTQAFSSVGGLLVALANACAVAWAAGTAADLFFGIKIPLVTLPEIHLPQWLNFFGGEITDHKAAWRYTLMSGLIPAIPLILVRPFLPESQKWAARRAAGTLKRPNIFELFSPALARTTIVSAIMFACALGAAFGAIQQIPQIVPGLPEVKAQQADAVAKATVKADKEGKFFTEKDKARVEKGRAQKIAAEVTKVQEVGGLLGRFALAALAVLFVSRRSLLRCFQIPGLIIMPLVFGYAAITGLNLLYVGIFFAGFFTVAQLSFWGNYLPAAYPVHLRGTGESFAANIGGRLVGTSMAFVVQMLSTAAFMPGVGSPAKMAYAAAIVGTAMYAIGLIASFWLPEPPAEHEEK